jgi:hypothetical protein
MNLGIQRIVSGGQTGVDRAALDWPIANGIEHGGWCPAGRRAEDGTIPPRYQVKETASPDYRVRTRRNVEDSDGTLVLNIGALEGGTLYTTECAKRLGKPYLVVQLESVAAQSAGDVRAWVTENRIQVLNVAGPRESKRPGVQAMGRCYLDALFTSGRVARAQRKSALQP